MKTTLKLIESDYLVKLGTKVIATVKKKSDGFWYIYSEGCHVWFAITKDENEMLEHVVSEYKKYK